MSNSIQEEMEAIKKYMEAQLLKTVNEIYSDIVSKTPVDTGNLKNSIQEYGIKKTKDGYKIGATKDSKDYNYSLMIKGRRFEDGKWQGSNQLPDGIIPHIRQLLKSKDIRFTVEGSSNDT